MLLYLGLAGGALYNWATSLYSFNRDAWMTDIQILQSHDYQHDNLQIAAHTMSRDMVRDRTTAAITKLNNYILVTTLIIALAAEMLVESQVPSDCADFVLNVYMLSLGSSILYLALGALFGVAASNIIYESTAVLLTSSHPPPWEDIDEKMHDREEQKMTGAFEKRPFRTIFMPPLLKRAFVHRDEIWKGVQNRKGDFTKMSLWSPTSPEQPLPRRRASIDQSQLCTARRGSSTGGAETSPLSTSTRDSERPSSSNPARGGATARRMSRVSIREVSPLRRTCAKTTLELKGKKEKKQVKVPLGAWGVAEASSSSEEECEGPERMPGISQIQDEYDKGYRQLEGTWGPLYAYSRSCVALGLHSLLVAYGYLCMVTLYGAYGSAGAYWAVQIIFTGLNMMVTMSIFRSSSWLTYIGSALGPLCCAIAAATPYLWLDRVLVPVCYISHTSLVFTFTTEASARDAEQGKLCEMPQHESESEIAMSPREYGLEEGGESPEGRSRADQRAEEHALESTKLAGRMVAWGGGVVRALWVVSVMWSFWKAIFSGGFGNKKALFQSFPMGPPVAKVVEVATSWPSVYFRPHAMVCPQGHTFFADEFRVFAMRPGGTQVEPYDCVVNSTIADLASRCDGHGECWPVLLLDMQPPMIYDCKERAAQHLLQSSTLGPARRFAEAGNGTIYVVHDKRVLQFDWAPRRRGWAPQWDVVKFREGAIEAMGTAGNKLLLFRSVDERTIGDGGSVEMLNLKTGALCAVWELPAFLSGAGCAETDAGAVLLLTHNENIGQRGSKLLKATLQRDDSFRCPDPETGGTAAAMAADAATETATEETSA